MQIANKLFPLSAAVEQMQRIVDVIARTGTVPPISFT
jgi:hypothetical protein